VRVHAGGEVGGIPYLAYELVPGKRTLADVQTTLDRAPLLQLISEVAEAVGHAHERGVVHRDLKPENILIDAGGRPRVADFGLAKLGGVAGLTATGVLVGTPAYMAPEQVAGEAASIGPPTDVWALGVTLYRCLSGEWPFEAKTIYELSGAILSGSPVLLRTHDPTISAGVQAVCFKALEKEPACRYANARAFAQDLNNAVALRPVLASAPSQQLLSWGRGQGPWGLAALFVLLSIGLAVWSVLHEEQQGGGPAQGESAQSYAERGKRFAQEGRYREAAEEFGWAIRRGGANEFALRQAQALFDAGDVESAERVCRAYLVEHKDRPGLHLLARIQMAAGLIGFAEKTFAELDSQFAGWDAEILRAELAEAKGEDPRPIFREATRRWPGRGDVEVAYARFLLRSQGDVIAAREVLAQPGELARVLEGLSEDPPRLDVVTQAPRWLREVGARWLLDEGIRDVGLLSQPPSTLLPKAVLDPEVRRSRAQGRLEAVLSLSTVKALRLRAEAGLAGRPEGREFVPAVGPKERQRAEALYSELRADQNRGVLERCPVILSINPDHLDARYQLGRERVVRGAVRVGLRDCLRCIVRQPRYANDLCLQLVAVSSRAGGLLLRANLEEMLKAVSAPEDSLDWAVYAFMLTMVAEFGSKSDLVDEALDALRQQLRRDPAVLWPRILRSFLTLRLGRYEETARDLRIVSEVAPDIGVVYFLKALLALRSGNSSGVRRNLDLGARNGFSLGLYPDCVGRIYPGLVPHLKRD
jgi:tetratricopeptide (TPR) repeat protein